MTKYFLAIIVSLFFLPLIASAVVLPAFNDVQFPQNTDILLTTPNQIFTILAGAQIESLTVNPSNFQISLGVGSSISVISLDRVLMGNSLVQTDCSNPNFSLITIDTVVLGITGSITVTPGGSCAFPGTGGTIGGGGGGGGVSAPVTTAGAVTVDAASGGTTTAITAENTKATVEVPAGAVTANTTIIVSPTAKADAAVAAATASAPSGLSVVGGFVYNLTANSGGTAVTSFNTALTVTFAYTDTQVAGLNEAALIVYRWTGTQWAALPSTVNAVANTITATTTQFSYFAVMGGTAAPGKPSVGYSGIPASFTFTKNLKSGMKDAGVVYLKTILAAEGCVSGLANTDYFASKTLTGAKCFCKKYKSDISVAAGYAVSCSGLVGAGMRTKLNALLTGNSSEQE